MRKLTSILLLTGVVALGLTACDDDEPTQPAPTIDAISVTPQSVTLQVGSTAQLAAQVQTSGNANPTVSWQSADTDVATVDGEGVVTGVQEGNTTVTATATAGNSSKSAAAQVTVNPAPAEVRGVSISPSEFTVSVGGTASLSATVDAQEGVSTDVDWSSSDSDIATVDGEGTVTGESEGNVTITATSVADPSKSASASGTVQQSGSADISIKGLEAANQNNISADNVNGRVFVNMNVESGDQTVTKVALMVDDTTVAEQTSSSSSDLANLAISSGEIQLSFNSAAFNDTTGAVAFKNGSHDLKAALYTDEDTTGTADEATLATTFANNNNLDVTVTQDGETADDAQGFTWFKGDVTVDVLPVIYDEDYSGTKRVRANMQDLVPASDTAITTTQSDSTASDGFTFAFMDADTTADKEIRGATSDSVRFRVTAVVDSNGTEALENVTPGNFGDKIRLDTEAPSGTLALAAPSINGWVQPGYAFSDSLTGGDNNGVGLESDPTFLAGTAGDTISDLDEVTDASDVASRTDSADGFEVLAIQTDRLGQADTTARVTFGVDNGDPIISFDNSAVQPKHRYNRTALGGQGQDSTFNVAQADDDDWATTAQDTAGSAGIPSNIPESFLGQTDDATSSEPILAYLVQRTSSTSTSCLIGDEANNASDDTDTVCDMTPTAGDEEIDNNTSSIVDGYYTYNANAWDQAGNQATATGERMAVVDDADPSVSSFDAPGSADEYTPAESNTTQVDLTDNLDLWKFKHQLRWNGFNQDASANGTAVLTDGDLHFQYGATTDIDPAFDATLVQSTTVDADIPFFPKGLQQNDGSGSFTAVDAPDDFWTEAHDAAGNKASSELTSITIDGGTGSVSNVLQWRISQPSDASTTIDVDGQNAGQFPTTLVMEGEALLTTSGASNPITRVEFYAAVDGDRLVHIATTTNINTDDVVSGFGIDRRELTFEATWNPTLDEMRDLLDNEPGTAVVNNVDINIMAVAYDSDGDAIITSGENNTTDSPRDDHSDNTVSLRK